MDATTHGATGNARTRVGDLSTRLSELVRAYGFPVALFVGLRVWTLVWASLAGALISRSAEGTKFYYGIEPLADAILAPWQRWDTIWYTKIAIEGYASDERVVFAPLFPLLIGLVRPLTQGNAVAAGLLIASVAALTSFVLLYRLGVQLGGEGAARRTLLFLACMPTAFFLFAAYAESLLLALVLGAFWCAGNKRWLAAGVLGGLAAMTRPQGVLFLAPMTVEFWMQYREGEITLRKAWTLGLVALGGLAHLGWLTVQFGSPGVWFEAQAVWHRVSLPWDSLGAAWRAVVLATTPVDAAVSFMDPFFAVVSLGALVWGARRLPLSMTVYLATIAIPPLFVVTSYAERYPLTAIARYMLVAFPLFLLLGSLPKRFWQVPVWALAFLAQTMWLMLFCAWVFVR